MDFSNLKSLTITEGEVKEIYSGDVLLWKGGYTNLLPLATEADGKTIYNGGKGWKAGIRLNSYGEETAVSNYKVTGFIPAKFGDTLYFENISSLAISNTKICFYDSSFANLNFISGQNKDFSFLEGGAYIINDNLSTSALKVSIENMAYFRLSVSELSDNSVITVNEEIE